MKEHRQIKAAVKQVWKKVMSRAELKIPQLELWLEPARLELITTKYGILIKIFPALRCLLADSLPPLSNKARSQP